MAASMSLAADTTAPRLLSPAALALLVAAVGALAGWPLYSAGLKAAAHGPAAEHGTGMVDALPQMLQAPAAAPHVAVPVDTVAELQRHLQRYPQDARALVLIAREHMKADRFGDAAAAYERAIAASQKVARDPGVWVELAEAKGLGLGGTLAGEPLALVNKALAIDPLHPRALDLAGSAAWEARNYAGAVEVWKRLLAQIPEGDIRRVELQAAIDAAERRGRFALPPDKLN